MLSPIDEGQISAESQSKQKPLYDLAFLLGATLIIFYASLIICAALVFIAGWKLTPLCIFLATIAGLFFYFMAGVKELRIKLKSLFAGLGILILVWIIALVAASWVYDMSWDGRDYQQRAIWKLENGWNPVSTELEPLDQYYNQWLNHYPKAPWIAAASIYQISGNIESGKAINLLLIVACFLITLSLFGSYSLNPVLAVAVSLLCAFNPVSMYQSFSYYVDGQVASMYAILLVLMLIAIHRPTRLVLLTIGAALVVGLNIKFTATIYLLIMVGGLTVWFAIRWYRHPKIWSMLGTLMISIIVGLFLAGYQPYVTNTLYYANPFYPVYGSQEFSQSYIVSKQIPSDLVGKNRLEKLFLTIFSRSENNSEQGSVSIKFPLSVSKQELIEFGVADLRVGGFGPWFGASVILAMIIWILLVIFDRTQGLGIFLIGGLIACTALINPETWWARYAPQWWLVVILVMGVGLFSRVKYARWLSIVLLIVLALNTGMVTSSNLYQNARDTWKTNQIFSDLAKRGETVLVYHQNFWLANLKFDQWHIPYKSVVTYEELPCPHEFMNGIYYSPLNCSP
jgi:hypothetical protein